ncbi:MAG: amidohydrolase family protein [Bacteroidales bacterium]|nr:amidohydrolase family protein [Bacteroidales bacterium]
MKNGTVVNENVIFKGGIYIEDEFIVDVYDYSQEGSFEKEARYASEANDVVDLCGCYVAPGIIDTHVHFREPWATDKSTIASESAAAALGGVTTYFDMPNNNPAVTNLALLDDKFLTASHDSVVNYSFYMGATDDNLDEIVRLDPHSVCGVKIFLGSSTGNMLLDDPAAIDHLFLKSPVPIMAHCEDNAIIQENLKKAQEQFGDDIPFTKHSEIRSREACIKSTDLAIKLALKNNTRLHIAHISTAEEVEMLRDAHAKSSRITGEACVGYLYFEEKDTSKYGPLIKCNPSIKSFYDRKAIRKGVRQGVISTVSTDHAPHLLSEKNSPYLQSPSGSPYVQFGFLMMLELVHKRVFKLSTVVDRMSHSPARCFNIEKRGFIKPGCYADLVVFDMNRKSTPDIAYKCGWSPLKSFSSTILHTMSNGSFVVFNGKLTGVRSAKKVLFT